MLLLQENTNSDWTIFGFDLYKLIEKLQGWGESFILKLPNFLVAVLVFVLFWHGAKYVSKFVRNIFNQFSLSAFSSFSANAS